MQLEVTGTGMLEMLSGDTGWFRWLDSEPCRVGFRLQSRCPNAGPQAEPQEPESRRACVQEAECHP